MSVDVTRISMWSGPRNISTTMMYSFAQRADTVVVDEPLYAAYLARTPDVAHPGADEVLASQDHDHRRVIDHLLHDVDGPIRFYKNMGHHLDGLDDWNFLTGLVNFVLTRPPADVIRSLSVNIAEPTLRDLGYAHLTAIVDALATAGQVPIVVVSSDILQDPATMLEALCARLGISWDPAMLSWDAGPRPEDGVWALHWYANVHRSTGFAPYRPTTDPLDDRFADLLAEATPYYERLLEFRLRA